MFFYYGGQRMEFSDEMPMYLVLPLVTPFDNF